MPEAGTPPCEVTTGTPGDGVDNDCDGQIDEEFPDGKDDDGDGLIDEDLMGSDCPGEFAPFDRTELFTLEGDCGISAFSLGLDCSLLKAKLWPFGDDGGEVEFGFSSSSIVEATDLQIGGVGGVHCKLEAFAGTTPFVELQCDSSQASCSSIFQP